MNDYLVVEAGNARAAHVDIEIIDADGAHDADRVQRGASGLVDRHPWNCRHRSAGAEREGGYWRTRASADGMMVLLAAVVGQRRDRRVDQVRKPAELHGD